LDIAPIALLHPPPYGADVEVLPGMDATRWFAAEWFSGRNDVCVGVADDIETYKRNLTPLWTAEKIGDLTTRKMHRIALMGDPDIDTSARPGLLEEIDSIQIHIDVLIYQLTGLLMAGRPPLRIGSHGKITRTYLGRGVWLARCRSDVRHRAFEPRTR